MGQTPLIHGVRQTPRLRVRMRQLQFLALAFLVAGCRRETPETAASGTASASPYTADSRERAREDGLEGTNSGSELEAPRLIPAVRNSWT